LSLLSLELQRLCAIELRNDGIIMCLFLRTGYTFLLLGKGDRDKWGTGGGRGTRGSELSPYYTLTPCYQPFLGTSPRGMQFP